jgi:hypothetical protein
MPRAMPRAWVGLRRTAVSSAQGFARRILSALGLMAPRLRDRVGETLDVLAQGPKMFGNRVDLFTEGVVFWHIGVFHGHLTLLAGLFPKRDTLSRIVKASSL